MKIMAAIFTPKHTEDFPLRDLRNEEFLVVALEAAHQAGWRITYISDVGFIAFNGEEDAAWQAELRVRIIQNYAELDVAASGSMRFEQQHIKGLIRDFRQRFLSLKPRYNELQLDLQYLALSPYIFRGPEDVLRQPRVAKKSYGLLSFFLPVKGYFMTPLLANLNILLFFLMVATGVDILQPDGRSLLSWGANYKPLTLYGQSWRLLTACFLHIGVVHLLLNMYALLSIGFLLEPYLGRRRFLAAYLLTGLVASLTSLWWHDAGISAGASGAIFGMYGVFLAMLTTSLIDPSARKPLLVSIIIFVGYNLIGGLKDGIDNAAHLGGLLSGLAIGYAFLPGLKHPDSKALKFGTLLLVTTVVLLAVFMGYQWLA